MQSKLVFTIFFLLIIHFEAAKMILILWYWVEYAYKSRTTRKTIVLRLCPVCSSKFGQMKYEFYT